MSKFFILISRRSPAVFVSNTTRLLEPSLNLIAVPEEEPIVIVVSCVFNAMVFMLISKRFKPLLAPKIIILFDVSRVINPSDADSPIINEAVEPPLMSRRVACVLISINAVSISNTETPLPAPK